MMKHRGSISVVLIITLMLAMNACTESGNLDSSSTNSLDQNTVENSIATFSSLAGAGEEIPQEIYFNQIVLNGYGCKSSQVDVFLRENLKKITSQIAGHGISESENIRVDNNPFYMLDLQTGTVNLDIFDLPVFIDGVLVDKITVMQSNNNLQYVTPNSTIWVAALNYELLNNPNEKYLLIKCPTQDGNYICLISAKNQIIYLARPQNGKDLPFVETVDYYNMLFNEKIIVSYKKFYGAN